MGGSHCSVLEELIRENRVAFAGRVEGWEAAIELAARPLLDDGSVEESYVQAMIDSVRKYGPYIVVAPGIAIPHAKVNAGVNRTAISLLKLEEPVHFSDNPDHDARLLFVLASSDGESHLTLLQSLAEEISDEALVRDIIEAHSVDQLRGVLKQRSAKGE